MRVTEEIVRAAMTNAAEGHSNKTGEVIGLLERNDADRTLRSGEERRFEISCGERHIPSGRVVQDTQPDVVEQLAVGLVLGLYHIGLASKLPLSGRPLDID